MKALIFGTGSIGKKFEQWLSEDGWFSEIRCVPSRSFLSDTEILGFSESELAHLVTRTITDLSLGTEHYDVAVIATPASYRLHACMVADGVSEFILIEKPIVSSAESLGFLKVLLDKKIELNQVAVGYVLRAQPCVKALREWLADSTLGRLLYCNISTGQYLPDWRPQADYRRTVSALKSLGGGVGRELSHELDLAQYLFGEFDLVDKYVARLSDLEIETEDFVNYRVETRAGVFTMITVDFLQREASMELKIVGSNGSLRGDLIREQFIVQTANAKEYDLELPRTESWGINYRRQILALMKRSPLCSFVEAERLVPVFDCSGESE